MTAIRNGCVHIYTGNGKGKTTAALGLALRASGAGLRVAIQQFLKNGDYGEIKALRKIGNIKVCQCGNKAFIKGRPSVSDFECAKKGFEKAGKDIFSKKYDLVILDEVNVAMKIGLIDIKEVANLINSKPKTVELVLTGRGCPTVIKNAADLVTEMREMRHPYQQGSCTRRGIEY